MESLTTHREIGNTYGEWKVLSTAKGEEPRYELLCLCECACGTTKTVRASSLRSGTSKSCGCKRQGKINGLSAHPVYVIWKGMIQRCCNPNQVSYKHYGGRGITICSRWAESFENFLEDMGERPEGTSLDRTDPDGNYEPDNCQWATYSSQTARRRRYRRVTKEEEKILAIVREKNLSLETLEKI